MLAFATAALATVFTSSTPGLSGGRPQRRRGLDAVDWSVGVHYAGTLLTLARLVAAWVTGSMWLHRARKNADVLAPDHHHTLGAGWAWGGWIVPVRGVLVPVPGGPRRARAVAPLETAALIGWWWALFLATVIGWRISATSRPMRSSASATPRVPRQLSVLVAAVMVAALVAWGLVLREITIEQHARMYGAAPSVGHVEHHRREPRRLPEAHALVGAAGRRRSSR